jgi:hypothetical protein
MSGSYWEDASVTGLAVPSDRSLGDVTADLARMLGDPDPATREGVARPTLVTWIRRGVYDDLMGGLGDGMASGLAVGLGERDTNTVFRRSCSAQVLAECLRRDRDRPLVPGGKVLEWGDRVATWLLRERDLRGFVPGHGWAAAVAHGADALAELARSPHVATPELTVILDVVADRVLVDAGRLLNAGEPDRLAGATMAVLRRDRVPLSVVEPWIARLAVAAADTSERDDDPFLHTGNAEAFLRALYLQLALAPRPPDIRSDLLLVLVDALKASNKRYLTVF